MKDATLRYPQPGPLGALALVVALASGCASTRPVADAPAPERIAPGRVAIVAARYAPEPDFTIYAQGRGAAAGENGAKTAAKGALAGALAPLLISAYIPPMIFLAPILVPIGAVAGAVTGGTAGAISGAWNGMPSQHVDALHRSVEHARRESTVQDAMAKRVLKEAASLPHYQFTYVADTGPASVSDSPDYQLLKVDGFDSVLELVVASVGFDASKGEPPSAVFEMKLNVRVVPLKGNGSPFVRELKHRGQWRDVPQWAIDDGKLLQQELDDSYAALAADLSRAVLSAVAAE
jgi:hypothetical protein